MSDKVKLPLKTCNILGVNINVTNINNTIYTIIKNLDIITPSAETPVGRLSGGNVQKVLVGREINSNPRVLMLAYPVRGLDINSSYTIYNLINEQKKKGVAVICVIEDLDILLELCDRIVVLNKGKVAAILDARTTNKEEVGLLMTKSGKESEENEQKLTTCK